MELMSAAAALAATGAATAIFVRATKVAAIAKFPITTASRCENGEQPPNVRAVALLAHDLTCFDLCIGGKDLEFGLAIGAKELVNGHGMAS